MGRPPETNQRESRRTERGRGPSSMQGRPTPQPATQTPQTSVLKVYLHKTHSWLELKNILSERNNVKKDMINDDHDLRDLTNIDLCLFYFWVTARLTFDLTLSACVWLSANHRARCPGRGGTIWRHRGGRGERGYLVLIYSCFICPVFSTSLFWSYRHCIVLFVPPYISLLQGRSDIIWPKRSRKLEVVASTI